MTPIDPIEAVARRLALLYDEPDWKKCEIAARAALTALRDCGVTRDMVEAGRDALHMSDPGLTIDDAFRAMLDAALKGE